MELLQNWNKNTDPYFLERSVLAFDLDDTLTENGVLPSFVIEYLEKAQQAKILTVLVTGRSDAWAECIVKLLPFDAVVAENGAVIRYWINGKSKRLQQESAEAIFWTKSGYQKEIPTTMSAELKELSHKILQKFPQVKIASDQTHRLYDLAIDFAEEVDPPRSLEEAEKIKDFCLSESFTARVSSIHVNAWRGDFSKYSGLELLLSKVFKKDMNKNLVYVGDSPNDAPLFERASMSVGVANIKNFISKLNFALPKFVASHESSRGACEVIEALLRK